jgi:nucleoside-diphosphate kinase
MISKVVNVCINANDHNLLAVFLRRVAIPKSLHPLIRVGSRVTINARRMEILDTADVYTKESVDSSDFVKSLVIVPPKSYMTAGFIIGSICRIASARITRIRMLKMDRRHVSDLLEDTNPSEDDFEFLIADVVTVIEFEHSTETEIQRYLGIVENEKNARVGPFFRGKLMSESHSSTILASEFPRSPEKPMDFLFDNKTNCIAQTAIMNFCALVIVKPHAFQDYVGPIVQLLLDSGFEISSMETRFLDLPFVERFLEGYAQALSCSVLHETCLELSSSTCLVLQVRSENVVPKLRELCGPMDPEIARVIAPNTIRARFGIDKIRNAVYCTDMEEDGIRDCKLMFGQ